MSDNIKPITKICIKCIEANKASGNVNSNFKIQCEYGACDVCNEHYVIVPFGRYFQSNVKVKPHTFKEIDKDKKPKEAPAEEEKKVEIKNIIDNSNGKKDK